MEWRVRLPGAIYRRARDRAGSDAQLAALVRDYLETYVSGQTPAQPLAAQGGRASAASLTAEERRAGSAAVLAPEITSIGTIEGQLEGLITHGKNRFYIYDPLSAKQIICSFDERVGREPVLQAFGKRVAATGIIRSRRSGERVSVQVSRLYVFPPDSELPRAADVRGILKAAK